MKLEAQQMAGLDLEYVGQYEQTPSVDLINQNGQYQFEFLCKANLK